MLFKVEFSTNCDELRPNIDAMIGACEGILESKTLRHFLRYVLHTGNFINAVSSLS